MSSNHYDTIIKPKWIITAAADGEVLENHAVAIKEGKIQALIPPSTSPFPTADTVFHLDHHILMPGLINLHGHSAMSLLRGLADDKPLMEWLDTVIWPAERKYMHEDFVFDGTCLAMAEMIRGGTTTVNDMYFFHSAVARAGLATGLRTFIGCTILEFPTNYAANASDYITRALEERREFLGEDLITFTLAPHSPYTVSDETFRTVITLAEQQDMLIHCHIHETQDEIIDSIRLYNQRPLARLKSLGVLSPRLIAAHMVHLNDTEIELAATHGIAIAHNPVSNMKLASGIAPIPSLLQQGVPVGIGTDGAASNNKLDMLAETRTAALLAKVGSHDSTVVPAYTAIRMATLNGARALGIEDKVGSIIKGKEADLIAINLSTLETAPTFDPVSHIVYAAGREQVSHVWIRGNTVMSDRKLTYVDESSLVGTAEKWKTRILFGK